MLAKVLVEVDFRKIRNREMWEDKGYLRYKKSMRVIVFCLLN